MNQTVIKMNCPHGDRLRQNIYSHILLPPKMSQKKTKSQCPKKTKSKCPQKDQILFRTQGILAEK